VCVCMGATGGKDCHSHHAAASQSPLSTQARVVMGDRGQQQGCVCVGGGVEEVGWVGAGGGSVCKNSKEVCVCLCVADTWVTEGWTRMLPS
jgi:hypothetical protein